MYRRSIIILFVVAQLTVFPVRARDTCNARLVNNDALKTICVCDANFCDELDFVWPETSGEIVLVISSQGGLRFYETREARDIPDSVSKRPMMRVLVDANITYQKILGWGGAITDSAAINILSLPEQLGDELIEDYYGSDGLQYNFARVPIGGSDFSPVAYSLDDTPEPDFGLSEWKLSQYDINYKIPVIRKALRVAKELKLIGAPWSPPVWMKTNKNFTRGFLIEEARVFKSYAEYLMKFFDAYEKRGINFWGASVQNDPKSSYHSFYPYNSMQFKNRVMRDFIVDYLGPALRGRGKTKANFKLIVGDDSLYFVNHLLPDLLKNPKVRKYVSGVAFHYYTSGILASYDDITKMTDSIRDEIEFVLMTEACAGANPLDRGVNLGEWNRAELYADDIIEDLLRGTNGWLDWNLALNPRGGPNWAKNFADSPIIVNKTEGAYYKQPMYYALAHFTKFFRPDSVRIDARVWAEPELKTAAVYNPAKNCIIVNVLSSSSHPQQLQLELKLPNGLTRFIDPFVIDAKSIVSIIVKL